MEQKYLTVDELADLLRTSRSTVHDWIHAGTGPRSIRPGRRRLFAVADVEAWLESLADDGVDRPHHGGRP